MTFRWLPSALILACFAPFAGCASLSVPDPTASEESSESQGAQGSSLAGTWTREDNGAEFTVEDDGSVVKGELTGGNEEYQGYFESYTFELKKDGDAYKGHATFAFKDDPKNPVKTKWEVTVDGDKLKGKLEYVKYDDDGKEAGRGTDEKVFALAAAAAAPPPSYTPPAVDMSAYVKPMANYKYMLYEGASVGHWIEVETSAAGQKNVSKWAVVAETDDAWVVEMDNQMNQKDLLIAVFIDKETGRCLKAFVGNRGKDGKEKDVPPEPEAAEAVEGPEAEDVEVEVKAGTFAAKYMEVSGSKSWIGTEGDAENVPLKTESAHGKDELVELKTETYEAGEASFDAVYLKYSSGREQWMAKGAKPHFNAQLRMKMSGSDTRLVKQGDGGAEPAFNYPR